MTCCVNSQGDVAEETENRQMESYVEHANLSVTDVDESVRFFTTAMPDLRVRHDSGPGPRRWVHLGTDTTYMSINRIPEPVDRQFKNVPPGFNHVGFVVEDADALRERMLAAVLDKVDGAFDFIIIDCSPSLNLLVINALTAADSVIIPVQSEYLAARGASMILSTIETIKQRRLNPNLEVMGLLLTMADTRTILAKDIVEAMEKQFGSEQHIFPVVVRRSIRFAESAVAGVSILAYDPKNPGAEAYRLLAREIADSHKRDSANG